MNWRDVISRGIWTFVQGFLALLLADQMNIVDIEVIKAAAIGGLAALLSFIKTIAAQQLA